LLEWRRQLVGDISGDVLEIGTGTGRNLPHYGRSRALGSKATVDLLLADAMRLPVADASVDWIVIGLALCSIPDPERALGEARRALRKEGRLRFVEHVRDAPGTRRGTIQDFINPAWRFVSGGCNCNRPTEDIIRMSGFDVTDVHHFKLGVAHLAPHIMGEATPTV
jgi:SAM-dependent methyltransferase